MADEIEKYLGRVAQQLQSKSVVAGYVNGARYPDGEYVAEVAFQDDHGNPAKRIPPRPFFRNAIAMNREAWKSLVVGGLRAGAATATVVETAGATIVADIQKSIRETMSPELSPVTIANRRDPKLRAAQGKPVNQSTKPLMDTRFMYTQTTYSVKDEE